MAETRALRRGLSRDAAVYATGDMAAKALGFVSVPVYTRVFEPEVFSSIAFLATVGALLTSVLTLGGDTVLSRFWFRDPTPDAVRQLVATWIGFLLLVSTTTSGLLLLAVVPLTDALLGREAPTAAVALLLASLPVALTNRMLGQVLRTQFRAVPYATSSFAVALGGLLAGLGLALGLDLGLTGVLAGQLAAEAAVLVYRALACRSVLGARPQASQLPELLRFGLPLVPVTLSFFVFSASDRLVVGKLAGLDDLAPYSVAVSLASLVALFCSAVGQAWVPRATELYERDRARAAEAFGQALTWYVVVLGGLAIAVSALAPELFAVVAPPEYESGARVLPLLVLGAVAYGSQLFTSGGLTMTQRTRRLATISVAAAALDLVLALTLVSVVGPVGAAVANVVGFVVLTSGYFAASQRAWAITLERVPLLVAATGTAAGTLCFATGWQPSLGVRLLVPLAFVVMVVASDRSRREGLAKVLRRD
jgi:O-antigen/teichoic acid export membrane protein